ncbi:MAG: hypothetical protein LBK66_09105 [Spirochaetaceae bacterium]|nr:hypothetical protein [Spirochaetaceae bacterium]
MTNETLENALKETWEKKDKFYEKNKDLSIREILIKLENKYEGRGASPNGTVCAPQLCMGTPLKRLGLRDA